MHTSLRLLVLLSLAFLVARCSSQSDPTGQDTVTDDELSELDTADTAGRQDLLPWDTQTDLGPGDQIVQDLIPDLTDVLDVQTDVPDDLGPDEADAGCLPVDCALWCPFGFATDANGCPICSCAGCSTDAQCAAEVVECIQPKCGDDGQCFCGCDGMPANKFECADGEEVPMCECTPVGYACIEDAHLQCAESCKPGDQWMMPCGDLIVDQALCQCVVPSCKPVCKAEGASPEGWYDSCTGLLILADECAGCTAYCESPEQPEEGWYNSCTDDLIQTEGCAPRVECSYGGTGCPTQQCPLGQSTIFTCPDGDEVTMCECSPLCAPKCDFMGTADEGIYNPCTGALVLAGKCSTCTISCDEIGSKSEGWYSSCGGLLYWENCGVGTWSCNEDVMSLCTDNTPCAGEGQFITNTVSNFGMCCPGLTLVKEMPSGPTAECDVDPQGEGFCIYCGDGVCGDHEYLCNCPQDCPVVPDKSAGDICFSDGECPAGTTCVFAPNHPTVGVCSIVCTPGPDSGCAAGLICASLPDYQAPGFCLSPCDPEQPSCPQGLSCGANVWGGDETFACWLWTQCNPVAQQGCDLSQCHLMQGMTFCAPTGTAGNGQECSPSTLCAPGLTCGVGSHCWPACETDEECQAMPDFYEFCLKKNGGQYGHCMVYL